MAAIEDDIFVTCEVCKIPFTGIEPYEQHLRGNKHWKAFKERQLRSSLDSQHDVIKSISLSEDEKHCSICNVIPDDIHEHLLSKDHLRMERERSREISFKCDVCNRTITGVVSFHQHMMSKPHEKAMRRVLIKDKLEDELNDDLRSDEMVTTKDILTSFGIQEFAFCNACLKKFGGPESYLQHMQSSGHKKKIIQQRLLLKIKEEMRSESEKFNISVPDKRCDLEESEFKCHDCEKSFSGAVPLAQHINSKVHYQKVHQNKLLKELIHSMSQELENEELALKSYNALEENDDLWNNPAFVCSTCHVSFSSPMNAKVHYDSKKHMRAVRWKSMIARQRKGSNGQEDHCNEESKENPRHPQEIKESTQHLQENKEKPQHPEENKENTQHLQENKENPQHLEERKENLETVRV